MQFSTRIRTIQNDIQALLRKGKGFIYEATKRARKLEHGAKFKKECEEQGENHILVLNEWFEGTGHAWADLDVTLTMFPRKRQWTHGKLTEMIHQATTTPRLKVKSAPEKTKPKITRHRVSHADMQKVKQHFKQELAVVRATAKSKDEIIAELKSEIRRLRAENSKLQTRIIQLTKKAK